MVLQGADLLFYPTAIGSEPEESSLDTKDLWQRAMIGHCVSNVVPVIAANRIGNENGQTFYGHSFIADQRGNKVVEMGRRKRRCFNCRTRSRGCPQKPRVVWVFSRPTA